MSALIDPDSYDDIIYRHGLTVLYNGGDLEFENGDLALTKDGDGRLGAIPYNSMFRLVQAWRYNAPAMRLMFDTIYELRNAKPELEQNLEQILSRGPKKGHFLPSDDVPLYHAANDAIGATEVSRSALAGSLTIVVGSLLTRFRDDLDVSAVDWNAGTPSYAAHSFGQVVTAAANSFTHADEWKKALFAQKTTSEQQRSMDVLKGALGLQTEYGLDNSCEAVLDLIAHQNFDELAKTALTFANNLALRR
jgi:hypothetical protein